NLQNAWGVSHNSSGGPFWVSNNKTGLATVYSVNPLTNVTTKLSLEVTIPPPGAGNPTGNVSNETSGFNGDRFLFVSEDGTISGWRNALGNTAEVLQTGSDANVYKGAALAVIPDATAVNHAYLYAANFRAGTIDVLKGDASAPNLTGNF